MKKINIALLSLFAFSFTLTAGLSWSTMIKLTDGKPLLYVETVFAKLNYNSLLAITVCSLALVALMIVEIIYVSKKIK